MRRANTYILLRAAAILFLVIAAVLSIFTLISYSTTRYNYPAGMSVGGVSIAGLSSQQASERLLLVYLSPIEMHYAGGIIQAAPADLGFKVDSESVLAAADQYRTGASFWGGFWNYLWSMNPVPIDIPLKTSLDEDRLKLYLQSEISARYDAPAEAAQPIPGTTEFTPGTPGQTLDIQGATSLIYQAMRSPTQRVVTLTAARGVASARAAFEDLGVLMQQVVSTSGFDGMIGVDMVDLQSGRVIHFALNNGTEIAVEPDVAFTASSTIKIPILVSYFIYQGKAPVPAIVDQKIINMIYKSDNIASDDVMALLDANLGPLTVTADMKSLGLVNTFLAGYFAPGSPLLQRFRTPANTRTDITYDLDVYNQTSPSDMGMLLEDIYQCSQDGGGALVAAYPAKLDKQVCSKIVDYLAADKIGVLIEAGLPEGTKVAHKHGWVPDTDGIVRNFSDAGIVYTPGGNYALAIYAHHPVQIVFDTANRLFANLARTVYNYYNTR